jgi:hypothetical protein
MFPDFVKKFLPLSYSIGFGFDRLMCRLMRGIGPANEGVPIWCRFVNW